MTKKKLTVVDVYKVSFLSPRGAKKCYDKGDFKNS
jgi:hypothetical protein